MTRIEDLVRDRLRQRAEDVEPTPALWREVDRRITGRRRWRVTSWSLSLVAAALAAFVVVPGMLGGTDPNGLEIEPMGPAGGVVPSVAVVAGSDGLALLELTTGERTPLDIAADGEVTELTVRPGSTPEDFDLAVVQALPSGGASLAVVHGRGDAATTASGQEYRDTSFVPSVRWSSDGGSIAYTDPGDAGGVELLVAPAPTADDGSPGFLDPAEATSVAGLPEGSSLLDWVLTDDESISELWIRQTDGTVGVLPLTAAGASVSAMQDEVSVAESWGGWHDGDGETMVTGVVAAMTADPSTTDGGLPMYLLAPGTQDGPSLFWSGSPDPDTLLSPAVEVPLDGQVGNADLADLWLDAEQDAALVGDGQQTWLFTHDGDGDFRPAVEVPDASAAALFDAPRPTVSADDGPPLPAPIVTVSTDELTLIGPDGPRTLVTLDDAGESRFVSARVRPGSTLDDLTVVALTASEGLWDLWDVRVVDGQVTRDPLSGAYAPAVGSPAGEGVAVFGPVWSPEGDKLAWFEFGTGPATLRTIGWDEDPGTGEPATDNATFTLEGLPDQPLLPMEWVAVPGTPGRTEIRGALMDFTEGWIAVPLEIQPDGAVAQPAGSSIVVVEPGPSGLSAGGVIGALASASGEPGVGLLVRSTLDGAEVVFDPYGDPRPVLLPNEILPNDGPPEYWVRPIGDGALVGSPNAALAWFVQPDGTLRQLAGDVVDADVLR